MKHFRILIGGLVLAMASVTALPSLAAEPEQTTQASPPAAASEAAPAPAAAGEAAAGGPQYNPLGAKACTRCHDEHSPWPVLDILNTPHAVKGDSRTPFAAHACELCHGASPEHMLPPANGAKRILPTVVFSGPNASPVAQRVAVCLSCHESGLRMNWQGSQHQSNDVACSSCHTIHTQKDPVLVKASQPTVCFSCHAEQRAQSFEFSHHPIREGKVVCADCHNPHGSPGPKLLKEFTVNETCYTCHAEKRGPLLWEHEPVREDCTNCHTPHGSTQARLLKERPPYLCQNCHDGTFHPGEPYSGQNVAGQTFNGAITAKFQFFGRSCVNCHSQIHGSNSPSGAYFMR